MANWDLGALARAAGAQLRSGELPGSVAAVGTDSRSLPPDALFVALRGERFDGHRFVDAAVKAGARAVLVDERGAAELGEEALGALGVPVAVVADTLVALGDIARWDRARHGRPVVGVTGSNGKTTTKELCACALGARGPVHKTEGNLNNLIGVPLTLLRWGEGTWAGVIEMGMNVPGEIARLTEIARPDVGVISNVAGAHLEGLGTVEAVARAKGELFAGLAEDAVAVVNADDPLIGSVACGFLRGQRRVRFGRSDGCEVRVLDHAHGPEGLRGRLEVEGRPVPVELPLFGAHNLLNAAAAVAAAVALGIDPVEAAGRLSAVVVPPGRLRVLRDVTHRSRVLHVIDDTYNANPESMAAAFEVLRDLAGSARRVAVLGDMLELGPTAAQLHWDVGLRAARSGAQWVLALGAEAESVAVGAGSGGAEAEAFRALPALLQRIDDVLEDDDWVLVKGSRGAHMEDVVRHLTGESA